MVRYLSSFARFLYSVCPGRYFAMEVLSIFIASTLHVFDITSGADISGKALEIGADTEGPLIMYVYRNVNTTKSDFVIST